MRSFTVALHHSTKFLTQISVHIRGFRTAILEPTGALAQMCRFLKRRPDLLRLSAVLETHSSLGLNDVGRAISASASRAESIHPLKHVPAVSSCIWTRVMLEAVFFASDHPAAERMTWWLFSTKDAIHASTS